MVYKDCRYCLLDFVHSKTAWVSDLSVQQDLVSTQYTNLFQTVLTISVFGTGVFHWHATHSNRYWPTPILPFPSSLPCFLTLNFQIISPRLWHLLHHILREVYSCTYIVFLFQRALHIKRNKGGVLHCNCCKHMALQCYLQMRLHWWHQLWRMDRL